MPRHVITATVINEPGVLSLVSGLFSARGFNIDSLVVGRTEDPNISRMTVVVDADDNTLEQCRKQLAKLVPVVKVRDFSGTAYVERDLAIITVSVGPDKRAEVVELVNLFRGKVIDIARSSLMIELSGPEAKIEAFIELISPYGIKEMARTGVIAMARGMQPSRDEDAPATKQPTAKRHRSIGAASGASLPPS
ncbi:MAG: acetolactate synthase small subunit [Phycisphaerae bacterium]|nr:acetolactate synthase small subunit [Phycisphaerae bacterium]MDW8261730.1 acetolactate synthase small subunit [Phycisphaerales bacterium]